MLRRFRLIGLLVCLLNVPALAAAPAPAPAPTPAPAPAVTTPAPAQAPTNPYALLEQGKFLEFGAPYQAAQDDYEQGRITDLQLAARFAAAPIAPQPALEPLFDKWVTTSPQSYVALVLRAEYHYNRAFALRGLQPLSDTTTGQTAGFNAEMIKARADLDKALGLSPRPTLAAARMIGTDGKLGMLENFPQIIALATKGDPVNIIVAKAILEELSPQGGGTYEAMLAFIDQQKKEQRLTAGQATYLDSIVLSSMGRDARDQGKYPEAAGYYKQAWAKEIAFDPTMRDALAGYTLTLYLQSIVNGNEGREPEVYQALNTLLQDDSYPGRGRYYGLRGEVRGRHLKDVAGAWSDFLKGAALKDPFSLYKVGVTYCQGVPNVVKVDRKACVAALRFAAARGSTEAQAALTKLSPKTRLYMPDLDPDLYWTAQQPISDLLLIDITNSLRPEEQNRLEDELVAIFKIPVKIINSKHAIELNYNAARGLYFAPGITHLDTLFRTQSLRPGEMVIALVGSALYGPTGDPVLSWTLPYERRAVISVQPVAEPASLFFTRLKKMVMRSVGLAARLDESRCVMAYAPTVAELDALPEAYCPEDAQVLQAQSIINPPQSGKTGLKSILAPGNSAGLGFIKMLIVTVVLFGGLGYIYLVAKPQADRAKKPVNPDRDALEIALRDKLERGMMNKREFSRELRALYKMSDTELSIRRTTTLAPKDPVT